MAAHICNVDCKPEPTVWRDAEGKEHPGTAHVMYASEPSSAAGRYQWEQNRAILDQGRRAWRESGQGQSRECRVWDEMRRNDKLEDNFPCGVLSRRDWRSENVN